MTTSWLPSQPGPQTAMPSPTARSSESEARLAPRRATYIAVRIDSGEQLAGPAIASDLSADGAFVRTTTKLEPGERLALRLTLPTDSRPIEVAARVVRTSPAGFGVRFEELAARDRARLRSHAGFLEMDDAIVRVQQRLGDLLPSNLLPVADPEGVEAILRTAIAGRYPISVLAQRGFQIDEATLAGLTLNDDPTRSTLTLDGVELVEDTTSRVVYIVFSDGSLFYAFEGVLLVPGQRPVLLAPQRLYVTERRTNRRSEAAGYCEFRAPHLTGGFTRFELLDLAEGGASMCVPLNTPFLVGTRLPHFMVSQNGYERPVSGATIRYLTRYDDQTLRVGLHFDDEPGQPSVFEDRSSRSLESTRGNRLRRTFALLRSRVSQVLGRQRSRIESGVEVVQYRNRRGESVVGLIDANFDTSDPSLRPDVAVLVAPALLKRKEVFGLQARTLVDDLGRGGRRVVVLRFDLCHLVGESTMNPKLVEQNQPYLEWDLSNLVDDINASLRYVEQRFNPQKCALVSVSFSAIAARRVVDDAGPRIDAWVAPFGCPDAQDMMRNYFAGLDLFPLWEKGEAPERMHVHGRPVLVDNWFAKAAELDLAYLAEARRDIAAITTPITWIVGTYDHWVTRSRVQQMLEAPGSGIREVFECATGHVLKEGPEAIEVFKLVSESVAKHIFGEDRPATDPDLRKFGEQSRAEWARVKRYRLGDARTFWHQHLFGSGGDDLAYDVLLEHPDYPQFLEHQVGLLDPQPDEDLADFGCGTGNLSRAILSTLTEDQAPASYTILDLVPEALERTATKVEETRIARKLGEFPCLQVNADLEVSRLRPIEDFLEGRAYGVEELAGRIGGLEALTAARIQECYGKALHKALRGAPLTRARLSTICPDLERTELDVIEEIGRAARFCHGKVLPTDLRPGREKATTALDLEFEHLSFADARPGATLDFPDESLDRIGCSLVVSYLADPLVAIREMHRILRPGGVLVVSSLQPNWDPSKQYREESELLRARVEKGDPEAAHQLEALRGFANMMSRLIELEEDGRFRFFGREELRDLLHEAGFARVNLFEGLGSPATAVIGRAVKLGSWGGSWDAPS